MPQPIPLRRRRHHDRMERAARTPFGSDAFGVFAEKAARFFGTPRFIVGQTIVVAAWIIVNALVVALHFDPYPFILLNLCFSTQAAYAAPLILLAQTRQADRDRAQSTADADHREAIAQAQSEQLALVADRLDCASEGGLQTILAAIDALRRQAGGPEPASA